MSNRLPPTRMPRLLICLIAALPAVSSVVPHADAQAPIPLTRISETVSIDGMVSEPVWQSVQPLPLTVLRPVFDGTPTQRSTIRVAYDDHNLYVAAEFFDTDPDGIRINSLYRDRYSNDDLLTVVLDPFNDNENALFFYVTPAGVRIDAAVSGDAVGSFRQIANFNWNTHWEAATIRNSDGWFAEARIPFSGIGFRSDDGAVTMGLIVYRFIARTNEVIGYPAIPADWLWYQPSRARDVLLSNVVAANPVYVSPYVLGGRTQSRVQPAPSKPDLTGDAGLDIKYDVTSGLTMDVTVNTDFAQVEADDQQVNLSRISLFFPDKRAFFQERSGLMAFGTGFRDRLFHSRRIGLSAAGEPVPILGGLRITGTEGPWDVGLLDMQTARSGDIPSENFGVLRLRRRILNDRSNAGGIATTRIDARGRQNVNLGVDSFLHLFGNDFLSIQAAQTVADHDTEFHALSSGMSRLRWERRAQHRLGYFADVTRYGNTFRPELGFVGRPATTQMFGEVAWGFLAPESSAVRLTQPSIAGALVLRSDAGLESAQLGGGVGWTRKSGSSISANVDWSVEDLRAPLHLPESSEVPTGRYSFTRGSISWNPPFGALLRTSAGMSAGQFYDGWSYGVNVTPTWYQSRHLELGGNYRADFVRFPRRGQSFDSHVAGLRIQAALDTRMSITSFVQVNSTLDRAIVNARFRYNVNEGSDFWIVYNEGLDSDGRLATIDRTVLVKYTHTFSL